MLAVFLTLVWKNYKKQSHHTVIFLMSIFVPMFAAVIPLMTPYYFEINTTESRIKTDDPTIDFKWNSFIRKINARRELMLSARPNFKANVFIPQTRVAYANSSHAGFNKLMEAALKSLGIAKNQTFGFESCDVMRTNASFEHYIASVCFHNEMRDESRNGLPRELHFSIIMPSEVRNYEHTWMGQTWEHSRPTDGHPLAKGAAEIDEDGATEYLREGFVPLQYYISTEYIRMASRGAKVPAPRLRPMYRAEATQDKFDETAVTATIVIIVIGFMFPVITLVKLMVEEHELGQCFVLEVNNAGRCLQVTAWFCNASIQLLVTALFISVLTMYSLTWFSELWFVFPFIAAYSISVASLIIFLSAVIRSAKLALVLVPIIWFLVPFPFLFTEELKFEGPFTLYLLATFLLCNVTLSRGITRLMTIYFGLSGSHQPPKTDGNYINFDTSKLIGIFFLQTLFYCLLVPIIQLREWLLFWRFLMSIPRRCRMCCRARRQRHLRHNLMNANTMFQRETRLAIDDTLRNLWKNLAFDTKKRGLRPPQTYESDDSEMEEVPPKDMTEKKDQKDKAKRRPVYNSETDSDLEKVPKKEKPKKKRATKQKKHKLDMESDENVAGIEFRRVSKKFSKGYVVQKFTLCVFPGEVVVLLGHNASGKTTIVRMICGLTLPTHGEIFMGGVNTAKSKLILNLKAHKRVGISLAINALFVELTVYDHLVFFGRLRGLEKAEARQEAGAYIRSLHMEDLQRTLVGNLSIGQKRIVQSICAFVGRTKVVLLHKPLDGVDEVTANLFFSFVQREKRNRSIFVTTNRSKVASGLGDRIGILVKGNLLFLGTERELSQDFNDVYRLTFYGNVHCDFDKIRMFLENYTTGGVEVESQLGDMAVYLINKDDLPGLISLLDDLPSHKVDLKIDGFKIQECSLDQILIKWFTPEPFTFAFQETQADHLKFRSKNIAWKRFMRRVTNFFIALRHRALMDMFNAHFLVIKILLPMVMTLWVALCIRHHPTNIKSVMNRGFPISEREGSGITLAQKGLSLDDEGPLKVAYDKYIATGAKEVDADLDITDVDGLRRSYGIYEDKSILATVMFKSDEVEARYNNRLGHAAPHSVALMMNSLAAGFVGFDSGIRADLETLRYAALHPLKLYNLPMLTITVVCFSCCFVWTIPMLYMNLSRDRRFDYIELIAGMRLSMFSLAILLYELFVFSIAFVAFHLAMIILEMDSVMYGEMFLMYAHVVMLVAVCVLSVNILIAIGSKVTHNAYMLVLSFHTMGILGYLVLREFDAASLKYIFIFLDFYPLFSMMDHITVISNVSDTRWLCRDVQIYETSVYVDKCRTKPNCCEDPTAHYYHHRFVACNYMFIIFIWILIYFRVRASLPKTTSRQGKYLWDSDADSYNDQHILHFSQPTDMQKSWIAEKSRVRTLEGGMVWKKSIHLGNLSVLFNKFVALNKINFMLDRHQVLSLYGPNGTGKTLLTKAILGFYAANTGRVSSPNRMPYQKYKLQIGHLAGYSAQEVFLMQKLTIMDVLIVVLRIRHFLKAQEVRQEAKGICQILNLYNYRHHILSTCSQGVLKRLSIALALMTNAQLVLLDDPFANLDVITQHTVLQSIQNARSHGLSIIYTCADTDFSSPAQRLVAISHTGLTAIGERHELTRNYHSSYYVIETKIHLPDIDAMMARKPGEDDEKDLASESRESRIYSRISDFVQRIFPKAIVSQVSYPRTCFWVSSHMYTMSQIFQELHYNQAYFYLFTIAQPSVGNLFLQNAPEQLENKPMHIK